MKINIKNNIQSAQLYSNNIASSITPAYITFNIEDDIFNKAKNTLSLLYPKTRLTNPFVIRIALNYYIANLKTSSACI